MKEPEIAFELEVVVVAVENLVPVRAVKEREKIRRYATILSSIREVGVTEPVIIYPMKGSAGKYLILDGHLRVQALREIGTQHVDCIISKQEESFTYNSRINRLAPIQEHRMIAKAVSHGVPVERIAAALNLSIEYIRENLNLLDGIHPETAELLGTHQISHHSLRLFKKVKPVRQFEMAELMISSNNFSAAYAKALFDTTPDDLLVEKRRESKSPAFTHEDAARVKEELKNLEADFKATEETFGENVLHLTLGLTYVRGLLGNARIVRWLTAQHIEILREFEALVATDSL